MNCRKISISTTLRMFFYVISEMNQTDHSSFYFPEGNTKNRCNFFPENSTNNKKQSCKNKFYFYCP